MAGAAKGEEFVRRAGCRLDQQPWEIYQLPAQDSEAEEEEARAEVGPRLGADGEYHFEEDPAEDPDDETDGGTAAEDFEVADADAVQTE